MPPKVSVVIPVYNVEQYLRQCLDSVVNQTLREIQIICVNDGSTDNSFSILQEYVSHDPRIEIVDKPNGGQASARNAAYPHIKGKYTFFVDSDDWIDLDTCRKTYLRAEQARAQIVEFFVDRYYESDNTFVPVITHYEAQEISDDSQKNNYLKNIPTSLCQRLFLSDLLVVNEIRCPEGLIMEDNLPCFLAGALAKKIVWQPECFYHYRVRQGSTVFSNGDAQLDILKVFELLSEELKKRGIYETFCDAFGYRKLTMIVHNFNAASSVPYHAKKQRYIDSLTAEDRDYIARNSFLPTKIKAFYERILNHKTNSVRQFIDSIYARTLKHFLGRVEQQVKKCLGHQHKKTSDFQAKQVKYMSDLTAQLCAEIVQIRSEIERKM
ncbi:MAG: glycosyltransferase family 2 protein [Thermoguttaceae bacterium]